MTNKRNKVTALNIIFIGCGILLSGCSVWKDEFDEPVPKGVKAPIHKISTMIDNGDFSDEDDDELGLKTKTYKDGEISRVQEDIRRVFVAAYEDTGGTLHGAHYLYIVAKPSAWTQGSIGK